MDDFGVKYGKKEDVEHLMEVSKPHYEMTNDWKGKTYYRLTLKWDYILRTCELFLPGYIKMMLLCFQHLQLTRPHDSPILQPPLNFERQCRKWPRRTTAPSLEKKAIEEPNKSLDASYFTQGRWTIPY